jgi:predicted metal-dependent HD superfamily phosphohydrolase
MTSSATVAAAWRDLAARHGLALPAAQAVLQELEAAYREPHRAYHTLDHIAALLALLDEHATRGLDRDSLVLAILFHDAIYDPARSDNESASADLAGARLTAHGLPAAMIERVRQLILATQHGASIEAGNDAEAALLLDLDLSVLAAPEDTYRAYAQAIRREYGLYPDAVYGPGRAKVLRAFLAREHIYFTPRLRALWEAPARANLAAEIARLELR